MKSAATRSFTCPASAFFRRFFGQRDDQVDDGLEASPAEHDRVEHLRLGEFGGFGFHHQHAFLRARDDQVEGGVFHLIDQRVQHQLAVNAADARGAHGAHEGNARDRQRRRGADQRRDVGFMLRVVGQDRRDNLHLVEELFREERADRAVDKARDKRVALRRAAFALEEAAGDLAGREIFFLVVDGKGEEILAFLDAARRDGGAENGAFTVGHEDRAVSLTGHAAGFKGQLLAVPHHFFFHDIKHLSFLFFAPNNKRRYSEPGHFLAFSPFFQRDIWHFPIRESKGLTFDIKNCIVPPCAKLFFMPGEPPREQAASI